MQSERKHERKTLIRQNRPAAIKALCRAAKAGDLAEVKQWLALDPSLINDADLDDTPLVWALDAPHPDVFLYLLSKGADAPVEYGNYNLAGYITLCSQWQPTEREAVLQALAEKGINLHPFLLAACIGGTEALSREALSVKDTHDNNVAHYASANGQLLLLQQLKSVQPNLMTNINRWRMSPLLFAALNGHLPVVRWLLQEGGAKITERTIQWGGLNRLTVCNYEWSSASRAMVAAGRGGQDHRANKLWRHRLNVSRPGEARECSELVDWRVWR